MVGPPTGENESRIKPTKKQCEVCESTSDYYQLNVILNVTTNKITFNFVPKQPIIKEYIEEYISQSSERTKSFIFINDKVSISSYIANITTSLTNFITRKMQDSLPHKKNRVHSPYVENGGENQLPYIMHKFFQYNATVEHKPMQEILSENHEATKERPKHRKKRRTKRKENGSSKKEAKCEGIKRSDSTTLQVQVEEDVRKRREAKMETASVPEKSEVSIRSIYVHKEKRKRRHKLKGTTSVCEKQSEHLLQRKALMEQLQQKNCNTTQAEMCPQTKLDVRKKRHHTKKKKTDLELDRESLNVHSSNLQDGTPVVIDDKQVYFVMLSHNKKKLQREGTQAEPPQVNEPPQIGECSNSADKPEKKLKSKFLNNTHIYISREHTRIGQKEENTQTEISNLEDATFAEQNEIESKIKALEARNLELPPFVSKPRAQHHKNFYSKDCSEVYYSNVEPNKLKKHKHRKHARENHQHTDCATKPNRTNCTTKSIRTEPNHAEPYHVELNHAEPYYAEPYHAEPNHADCKSKQVIHLPTRMPNRSSEYFDTATLTFQKNKAVQQTIPEDIIPSCKMSSITELKYEKVKQFEENLRRRSPPRRELSFTQLNLAPVVALYKTPSRSNAYSYHSLLKGELSPIPEHRGCDRPERHKKKGTRTKSNDKKSSISELVTKKEKSKMRSGFKSFIDSVNRKRLYHGKKKVVSTDRLIEISTKATDEDGTTKIGFTVEGIEPPKKLIIRDGNETTNNPSNPYLEEKLKRLHMTYFPIIQIVSVDDTGNSDSMSTGGFTRGNDTDPSGSQMLNNKSSECSAFAAKLDEEANKSDDHNSTTNNTEEQQSELFFRDQRNGKMVQKMDENECGDRKTFEKENVVNLMMHLTDKFENREDRIANLEILLNKNRNPKPNVSYKVPKKHVYKPKDVKTKVVDVLYEAKNKYAKEVDRSEEKLQHKIVEVKPTAVAPTSLESREMEKKVHRKFSKIPRLKRTMYKSYQNTVSRENLNSAVETIIKFPNSKVTHRTHPQDSPKEVPKIRISIRKPSITKFGDTRRPMYKPEHLLKTKHSGSFIHLCRTSYNRNKMKLAKVNPNKDYQLKPKVHPAQPTCVNSTQHSPRTKYFLKRFLQSLGEDEGVNASKLEVSINNIFQHEYSANQIEKFTFMEENKTIVVTKVGQSMPKVAQNMPKVTSSSQINIVGRNRRDILSRTSSSMDNVWIHDKLSSTALDSKLGQYPSTNYLNGRDYCQTYFGHRFNYEENSPYHYVVRKPGESELISLQVPKSYDSPFGNRVESEPPAANPEQPKVRNLSDKTLKFMGRPASGVNYTGLACYMCKKLICCCEKDKPPEDEPPPPKPQHCYPTIPTIIRPVPVAKPRASKDSPQVKAAFVKSNFPKNMSYGKELLKPMPLLGNNVYQTFVVLTEQGPGDNNPATSTPPSPTLFARNSIDSDMPRSSSLTTVSKEDTKNKPVRKSFGQTDTSSSETDLDFYKKKRIKSRRRSALEQSLQASRNVMMNVKKSLQNMDLSTSSTSSVPSAKANAAKTDTKTQEEHNKNTPRITTCDAECQSVCDVACQSNESSLAMTTLNRVPPQSAVTITSWRHAKLSGTPSEKTSSEQIEPPFFLHKKPKMLENLGITGNSKQSVKSDNISFKQDSFSADSLNSMEHPHPAPEYAPPHPAPEYAPSRPEFKPEKKMTSFRCLAEAPLMTYLVYNSTVESDNPYEYYKKANADANIAIPCTSTSSRQTHLSEESGYESNTKKPARNLMKKSGVLLEIFKKSHKKSGKYFCSLDSNENFQDRNSKLNPNLGSVLCTSALKGVYKFTKECEATNRMLKQVIMNYNVAGSKTAKDACAPETASKGKKSSNYCELSAESAQAHFPSTVMTSEDHVHRPSLLQKLYKDKKNKNMNKRNSLDENAEKPDKSLSKGFWRKQRKSNDESINSNTKTGEESQPNQSKSNSMRYRKSNDESNSIKSGEEIRNNRSSFDAPKNSIIGEEDVGQEEETSNKPRSSIKSNEMSKNEFRKRSTSVSLKVDSEHLSSSGLNQLVPESHNSNSIYRKSSQGPSFMLPGSSFVLTTTEAEKIQSIQTEPKPRKKARSADEYPDAKRITGVGQLDASMTYAILSDIQKEQMMSEAVHLNLFSQLSLENIRRRILDKKVVDRKSKTKRSKTKRESEPRSALEPSPELESPELEPSTELEPAPGLEPGSAPELELSPEEIEEFESEKFPSFHQPSQNVDVVTKASEIMQPKCQKSSHAVFPNSKPPRSSVTFLDNIINSQMQHAKLKSDTKFVPSVESESVIDYPTDRASTKKRTTSIFSRFSRGHKNADVAGYNDPNDNEDPTNKSHKSKKRKENSPDRKEVKDLYQNKDYSESDKAIEPICHKIMDTLHLGKCTKAKPEKCPKTSCKTESPDRNQRGKSGKCECLTHPGIIDYQQQIEDCKAYYEKIRIEEDARKKGYYKQYTDFTEIPLYILLGKKVPPKKGEPVEAGIQTSSLLRPAKEESTEETTEEPTEETTEEPPEETREEPKDATQEKLDMAIEKLFSGETPVSGLSAITKSTEEPTKIESLDDPSLRTLVSAKFSDFSEYKVEDVELKNFVSGIVHGLVRKATEPKISRVSVDEWMPSSSEIDERKKTFDDVRQGLTDKEVFDKLLDTYEKEDGVAERLSSDNTFFADQLGQVKTQESAEKIVTRLPSIDEDDEKTLVASESKVRFAMKADDGITFEKKPMTTGPYEVVDPAEIGHCFTRGFRTDNIALSGDACFAFNKQDKIKASKINVDAESIIDFSERDTPLDFLLALGFMVDEATNALKDEDVEHRLLAAITEARVWINQITTTQGTLLYLVALKAKPRTMRYFLQLVEAIINKRINNAVKLDGFLRTLEKIEDGEIGMMNIFGLTQFEDEDNEEKVVKNQLREVFISVYKVAEKEANKRGVTLSVEGLLLLRILAARYRAGLHPHLELIASYIGQGLLVTDVQLEAAMIFLSRLDTVDVKIKEFEKYCGIGLISIETHPVSDTGTK